MNLRGRQSRTARRYFLIEILLVTFAREVKLLSSMIEEMGNSFSENRNDLHVLGSRNIADVAVAETVNQIEKLGINKYEIC